MKRVQAVLWRDVLCPESCVAESRLTQLVSSHFAEFLTLHVRPFPAPFAPTRVLERMRREPEGAYLSDELWKRERAPRDGLRALVAIEAAGLQGASARWRYAFAAQRAALELGLDVTRDDVAIELASQLGLEMERFCAALRSCQTEQLVLARAHSAVGRGVKRAPTLVLADRWMVAGLRGADEYRRILRGCLEKAEVPQAALH